MAFNPRTRARLLLLALGLLGLIAVVWFQSGCVSVGKGPNGEAVIGIAAGLHPDADAVDGAANAAGTIVGTLTGNPVLGEGVKWAVGGLGTLLLGAGGLGAASARARRRAEVRAAELAGAERGWVDRETAAAVQLPIGGGVVGGGAPAAGGAGAPEAGEVTQ